MGGHTFACSRAALALNNTAELINGHAVAAHLDECAHHGAHHVAQKTVGSDAEIPMRGRQLYPPRLGDATERGLYVCMCLAESPEVAVCTKNGSRLVHQVEIELVMNLT